MGRSIAQGLVDDPVAGHDRESTRHGAHEDVGDGSGGLDRCDANLAEEFTVALHEHFRVGHDALAVTETEDDEIPSLVDGENGAGEALAYLQLLASVFLAPEFGDLRAQAGILVLELLVDRLEFGEARLEFGVVDIGGFGRALRGGGGLLLELGDARVFSLGVLLELIHLGLDGCDLLLRRSEFVFCFVQIGAGLAELGVQCVFLAAELGDLFFLLLQLFLQQKVCLVQIEIVMVVSVLLGILGQLL